MQQSQALILMSQMKRIEKDNDIRLSNALYLDKKLREIPGIFPSTGSGLNTPGHCSALGRYLKIQGKPGSGLIDPTMPYNWSEG